MAEIPSADYLHRSIDQLRSMNERGTLGAVIHDYKQFTDLRNNIVADYTTKNNLNNNNNNNLIDNRNTTSANLNNNQSPDIVEQKHQVNQQHYSSPSTPPTPLSITEQQMNDAKVRMHFMPTILLNRYLNDSNLGKEKSSTRLSNSIRK